MKPIALAQQIMLLHSWSSNNEGSTGELWDTIILPSKTKSELYIPRNPEADNLQSVRTKFLIETFGIGKVVMTDTHFIIRTFYDPKAYGDHTVRILRLNTPTTRRGKDCMYATEIYLVGHQAVRYSETLYDAMFKARPSLVLATKMAYPLSIEGTPILTMAPDYMRLNIGNLTNEEILSLHKSSFQCNLRV